MSLGMCWGSTTLAVQPLRMPRIGVLCVLPFVMVMVSGHFLRSLEMILFVALASVMLGLGTVPVDTSPDSTGVPVQGSCPKVEPYRFPDGTALYANGDQRNSRRVYAGDAVYGDYLGLGAFSMQP